MVDPDIFNDVPLFALLDADERLVLAQQVSARNFAKGEVVYKAGEAGKHAYLMQLGKVQLTITDLAQDEIIVDIVDPGGIFGLSSMLAQADHMTTAVALEDSCAIEIDRHDIGTLLEKKPQAGLDMLTMAETHMRATHELVRTRVTRNPNQEIEEAESLGDRLADLVAKFGGSWAFVLTFAATLIIYVTINVIIGKPWDPYPFILLNLFLSMLAAIQAPVIMMSQNRQDSKDRVRSELDYRVNLKAELEIGELMLRVRRIEEKMDAKSPAKG